MTKRIGLILGSTRPGRISPSIASWIESAIAKDANLKVEILDLKDINLPFFDEPTIPSDAPGVSEAAKKWSALVSSMDAFIILASEYNAGYAAPLKNAIDYLRPEWKDRPIFIVSYGFGGGVSAAHQLTEVFNRLGSVLVEPGIAITIGDKLNENKGIDEPHRQLAIHDEELAIALKSIEDFVPQVA